MNYDVSEAIAVLQRTPHVVRSLLDGLPDSWTQVNEGGETWRAYDVVGHLIHGERADWIPRAKIILARGADRKFPPFDRTAQFRDSVGKSLTELLGEFHRLRADNLATLSSWKLGDAELALEGIHPEFGAVTLRQHLATWVAHDLTHVAQIVRVMATQYRDAVGPWRKYLSVLNER